MRCCGVGDVHAFPLTQHVSMITPLTFQIISVVQVAEEKKKKLRAERKAAAAGDIETLVDDVFGTLKGKKADEIVDSLKVSALQSSSSRRKGSAGKRIGSGSGKRRHKQGREGAAENDGDEDDALAAMMSKLGVEGGGSSRYVRCACTSFLTKCVRVGWCCHDVALRHHQINGEEKVFQSYRHRPHRVHDIL